MTQFYLILAVLSVALPLVASQACADEHTDCHTRNCRNRRVRRECPFSCGRCVGNPLAQWNNWGPWSACDATCGLGRRRRERECKLPNPPPPPPPPPCDGSDEESEDCFLQSCFTDWEPCSKTCGTGTQRREDCTGTCVSQFQACNTQSCPRDSTCDSGLTEFRYGSTEDCCSDTQVPTDTFCGSSTSTKRIINGIPSLPEQWPWLVAVEVETTSGGKSFCGGAIISPTFILTAAHCLKDENNGDDFIVTTIYPGIIKLEDIGTVPALPVGVRRKIVHPDFRMNSVKDSDIALIELDRSLIYSPTVHPICLPHGEETPVDEYCFIAGWGVSEVVLQVPSPIDPNMNRLREAKIYNFEPLTCTDRYKSINSVAGQVSFLETYDGFLCAGRLDQRIDSCTGDSGSPLVCQRCGGSCTWYVAGVTSFGPNPCALLQAPGIYTKVTHFEDWIFATTGIERHTVPAC